MQHIAEQVAHTATPGQIILLNGDLGAGKTTMVKFIAAAFGIAEPVSSPTFNLQNVYPLKNPCRGIEALLHYDLYRIKYWEEVLDLGLFELSEGSVSLVEWAERFERWPRDTPTINIAHETELERTVTLLNFNFPPQRFTL